MQDPKPHRLATRAVHAGTRKGHSDYRPTVTPIHPAVTYLYDKMEDMDAIFAGTREGYVYSRYGNPTVTALEEAVAALEEGETALAFGSGMAAIHATLLGLGARSSSTVVAAQDIYGVTHALLTDLLHSQGVGVHFVDASDLPAVERTCTAAQPVALLVETLSNPLLRMANLPALGEIAHRHGASLIVDNTFATPCLVQPLHLGADVVVHSATKYLGGHGDVLGGIVVTTKEMVEGITSVLKLTGANLGPQEAWLVLRGIKTLPLRMRQHCENALAVARWLETRPEVSRVIYPGLPSHPQHALADELLGQRGYGGVVAFDLADADQERVFCFFEALDLCQPATTLGDVHSLVLYPAHSSHRALSAAERAHIGIGDGLVRLSVGIEAVEDITDDLAQALERIT